MSPRRAAGTATLDRAPRKVADAASIGSADQARTGGVVEALIAPVGPGLVVHLAVDELVAHPENPRTDVGDVDALAASIRAAGILEPLIVTTARAFAAEDPHLQPTNLDAYVIIAGHRRVAAAREAGLTTVPCVVREDLVGPAAREAMLIENLHREDLTPVEEAQAFDQLRLLGLSQRQIAERVGCNQSHISKRLDLLKLPPEYRRRIGDSLTVQDALELAKLADHPGRLKDAISRKWEPVATAVRRHLDEIEGERKAAAAREKLKAEGVKVVKSPGYSWWGQKTQPLAYLRDDGSLKLSDAEHAAEPCHAAVIGEGHRAGEVTLVCTDPSRHGVTTVRGGSVKSARQETAERKQREARKAAHTARVAHLSRLLTGPLDKALTTWALTEALHSAERGNSQDDRRLAAQLLGYVDATKDRAGDTVRRHAARDTTSLQRALLASLAAGIELEVASEYAGAWHFGADRPGRRYMELLIATGYTPSTHETKLLEQGIDDEASS